MARDSPVDAACSTGLRRELVLVDQPAEQVKATHAIEVDHVAEWLLVADRHSSSRRTDQYTNDTTTP